MYKKTLFLIIFTCLFNSYLIAQVTFIIESLPETTPPYDTIFISGTFNDWIVNDPNYILQKQLNGRFAITLAIGEGRHEYKFTRGSWVKAETGKKNEYIPNRVVEDNGGQEVYIKILNWQDHGGVRKFSYVVFYYFAIAFQALALILWALRDKKKDSDRAFGFYALNSGLFILFLGIVCYSAFSPIWQTYLIFLIQILILTWGPLCYLFVQSFSDNKLNKLWFHFLPAVLAAGIISLKFFNINPLTQIIGTGYGALLWQDFALAGFGALHATIYTIGLIGQLEFKLLKSIRIDFRHNFMRLFLLINHAAQITIFFYLYLIFTDSWSQFLSEFNPPFILLSSLVILETYYIWKYPKLLKESVRSVENNQGEDLLVKLQTLMETNKVHRDAKLNINDLSNMLNTKSHILSKVLNTHHKKSFRDFVNDYRIKEFIHLAKCGELERYTFLGLAHEVGFNSKSTFNLAFKKNTKQSPRDFLKSIK